MPKLIVNADDFGMSAGISKAIAICGQVCGQMSTSLMTCVPGARDLVVKYLHEFRGCVGLHLQLSEGVPVLGRKFAPSLTGPSGEFLIDERSPTFAEEVLSEWRAQAARISSWGIVASHVDSHRNMHSLPVLWHAHALVAEEFGLRARSGSAKSMRFLRMRGLCGPDVSIRFWRLEPTLDVLCGALDTYRTSGRDFTVEIVGHPGLVEEDDPTVVGSERRKREFDIFSNERTYERFQDLGWEIIRYDEIAVRGS